MSLPGDEFIRRFLIHVLPEGFRHIRHFGFLGNNHRARKLALCRELLRMAPAAASKPPVGYRDRSPRDTNRCRQPWRGRDRSRAQEGAG
jgi:hypothetical protein